MTPSLATAARLVRRFDESSARVSQSRRVLFHVRTAMHAGVLDPVARVLERDLRLDVRYSSEPGRHRADIDRMCGRPLRWMSPRRASIVRIDLFVSADPWQPPVLYRCRRRINFFHGVAGKYDLDDPREMPAGFEQYDRVAFVNADRMHRYLASGIVSSDAAVLVGFPKLDALVNGRYDAAAVHARLGLEMHRRTAIYAPTWSPASSLHLAGEAIVTSLVNAGWNVIVKPHARSFDRDERYSGGIDWRARLRAIERPGRVVLSEAADASPLLAASDLMVTDHSTIGFEFCVLDRPLIVFDAPDLARVARINPERVSALRSAARVVSDGDDVGEAANEEMAHPERLSSARVEVSRPMFYEPGTATERALSVVYELLELPAGHLLQASNRFTMAGRIAQ